LEYQIHTLTCTRGNLWQIINTVLAQESSRFKQEDHNKEYLLW